MMPDTNENDYPAILPVGDEYHDLKDNGLLWRVTGSMVGGQPDGAILGIKDFQPGAHIQWLLDRGSITPLTESEAKGYRESSPAKFPMPYHEDPRPKMQAKADTPAAPDVKVENALSTPPAKVDGRTTRHQNNN